MKVDSKLLLAIYDSVTSDEAFGRVLALLAQSFDCRSAALFYVVPHRAAADISIAHGTLADPELRERYDRDFAAIDPAPALLAKLQVGDISSTDHAYSATDVLRYAPFLDGFYHPAGLGGALGGPVANQDGQLGMIAVQRPLSRAPFSTTDIQDFRALMPHLIKAITLRGAFFEVSSRADHLERSCEAVPTGMLIFDQTGALDRANLMARRIIARNDDLSLDRAGRLREENKSVDRALRKLFDGRLAADRGGVLLVPRASGPAPYGLRIAHSEVPPSTSVLISDPTRHAPSAEGILAALFGLTEARAKLAAALVRGESLDDYAARTGISINTARVHLSAVFQAMGARRQSDVVRLAGILVHELS